MFLSSPSMSCFENRDVKNFDSHLVIPHKKYGNKNEILRTESLLKSRNAKLEENKCSPSIISKNRS